MFVIVLVFYSEIVLCVVQDKQISNYVAIAKNWDFGEWAALCGCGKGWSRPNLRGALRGFPRSPRGGELSAQPVTRGPQTSGARLLRLSWCYSIYFGSELWSWDHSDLPRVTQQDGERASIRIHISLFFPRWHVGFWMSDDVSSPGSSICLPALAQALSGISNSLYPATDSKITITL